MLFVSSILHPTRHPYRRTRLLEVLAVIRPVILVLLRQLETSEWIVVHQTEHVHLCLTEECLVEVVVLDCFFNSISAFPRNVDTHRETAAPRLPRHLKTNQSLVDDQETRREV